MLKDIQKFRSLLKGVNTIDIVSFGSAISPEYLITLLSEASWNGRSNERYGFIGASLPGAGWNGGFNELLTSRCVDWVIGGFFGATRKISVNINNNNVEVHNLPQGIIAKLLTDSKRSMKSHIGSGTFIDPTFQGSLINEKSKFDLNPVCSTSDNQLDYSLPCSDLVMIRGSGFSMDGSIVLETDPIDLDIHRIIKSAVIRKSKIAIQVPDKIIEQGTVQVADRSLFDEIFVSPANLHTTTYMQKRYLSSTNPFITRSCSTTESLSKQLKKRVLSNESLIVGIGLPVSAINKYINDNSNKLDINIESGNRGGIILDGDGFGLSIGGSKPISQLRIFEKIWNGNIDHALLGVGDIDENNNINIAKLGDKFFGVGGFLDITQSINKITFCSRKKDKLKKLNEFNCYENISETDAVFLQA